MSRAPRAPDFEGQHSPAQQADLLVPHPLAAPCTPGYPSQLGTSESDWGEVDTVVDHIILHRNVSKVALVGWSAAAFQLGPYTLQHPQKVASLLLLAPIFPPKGRASKAGTRFDPPVPLPVSSPAATFGFPMNLSSRETFGSAWDRELHCPKQREDGMVD
nr:alpha/beta hydrolase [Streptomyces sp. TLI_235]